MYVRMGNQSFRDIYSYGIKRNRTKILFVKPNMSKVSATAVFRQHHELHGMSPRACDFDGKHRILNYEVTLSPLSVSSSLFGRPMQKRNIRGSKMTEMTDKNSNHSSIACENRPCSAFSAVGF